MFRTTFSVRRTALFLAVMAVTQACDSGDDATGPDDATVLTSGTAVTNLSGGEGSERVFRISVPAGTPSLSIATQGGSGDLDLYVRYAAVPTESDVDCESVSDTNDETCVIDSPEAGDWYVMVYGYEAYSGASLIARTGSGTAPTSEIYFRVQQDLSAPAGSGWCDTPSSNFTDDNPATPDVPNAHMTSFAGPSGAGTFNAQYVFAPGNTVTFTYTLARPTSGYRRYYTQLLRDYDPNLNRCIDVSRDARYLSFVDERI